MNIEHFALNVPDPVRMAQWYVQHLGMRVLRQQSESPFTHFLADESGRGVVEIYHNTRAPIPDYANLDPLVVHLAFVSADIANDRQRLLAAGATLATDIVTTPTGDEMTFVHDPWGVVVQLVKRRTPLQG